MKISFSKSNQSGRQRRVDFAFLLAVFLGSCVTTELRSQVVVVPNSLTATDGNSRAETGGNPGGLRYMQVFDASHFAGINGPIRITQFANRPDIQPGPSGPRVVTLQVFLSTTTRSVAGLSTTFANNIGLDNTLVFSGTLTLKTANLPGPGNTKQFDIVFPFNTPFLYDPAAGNLLIDVQISGSTGADNIVRDTVSGDPSTKFIVGFDSPTVAIGDVNVPFVTRFTFEPPPLVIVAPNALATKDGNDFGQTSDGPVGGIRNMYIFDASQFGVLSRPSLLTQFAERPDMIPDASGPRSPSLRIYASTTTRSVAGLSKTFAENLGTNNTLVFDGTLSLATANLTGPGNTRQFDIVFPFTTPFLYDPAAGNLLLDIQISSSSGQSIRFDTVSENPMAKGVSAGGSPTAPVGDFSSPSVVQFTFEPAPLVTIRASQVEVCWNSKSNVTYQVQYRSDLTTNLWTSLVDCVRSTGATSCISDPVPLGQPQRFYRVALTNCVPQ